MFPILVLLHAWIDGILDLASWVMGRSLGGTSERSNTGWMAGGPLGNQANRTGYPTLSPLIRSWGLRADSGWQNSRVVFPGNITKSELGCDLYRDHSAWWLALWPTGTAGFLLAFHRSGIHGPRRA
ncbi:MAG TPA: hypothetical protein VIY86_03465 [Pirellulaceae bacterium]